MTSKKPTDTVALFGLPITNVTMDQTLSRIEEYIASGTTHQIATANLDFARNSLKSDYLQRIICECSMVLPDGAPMLWASSMFQSPLQERVTGVDLIPGLAQLSARKGYGIFLLGSTEQDSADAAAVLRQRFPGVRIVGRHCPPVAALHEMDNEDILSRIEEADPQILLVAFGNPKQEIWIHRHRERLSVPIAIGVGGALNMIAGSLKRAPRWVQAMHMEWAFRLAQEPMRLLPRYAHDAAALLMHLPLGLAVNRLQPLERRHGRLEVRYEGTVRIVSTPARLSGEVSRLLAREAREAAEAGQTVVVDMSATVRVEADGLGGLLEARRLLLAQGLWIWLSGMSIPVRRVLQFSAMADLFRIAGKPEEAVRYSAAAMASSRHPASATRGGRMSASPVAKAS